MLLQSYTKEIFRPECNPSFQSLHCIAHLDQDVSEALPYLNSMLGGFDYFKEPPAVTFRIQGKIITVHPREIAVNALKDEEEADKDSAMASTGDQRGLGKKGRDQAKFEDSRNRKCWRF